MAKKKIVQEAVEKASDKTLLKKHIICRGNQYIVTFKYDDGSEVKQTCKDLGAAKKLQG